MVATPEVSMLEKIAELWREARYGVRLLRKNPGLTIIVGITLALGIGATTAIFSVLYATALAPLPFADPSRLVFMELMTPEGRNRAIPVDAVDAWRTNAKTLDAISGLLGGVTATVSGPSGPERILLEQVDFHTLEVLGVRPMLGRWFQTDEVIVQGNVAQTIVISYGLWQRVFGGAPDVIGKKMPGWTAGWGETVIGVMPRGFYTQPERSNIDAWYLITRNPGPAIARLKAGVRPEQAEAELTGLGWQDPASKNAQQSPAWTLHLIPLQEFYRQDYARTVYMLLGAVGFVLLIASVNVANLQLNRSVKRLPEMAARMALGASRGRLLRQLVIENVVLALFGGALGLVLAQVGIRMFILLAPNFYRPADEIAVNGYVLLFALGICLTSGILSGLVPGFRGSNPDLSASLKEGGRGIVGRERLGIRRTLVVLELALAMVLLVGAGLMIKSYARLTGVDIGLDPDNVLTFEVNLFGMDRYRVRHASNHYSATPEISNFYARVLDRLARLPGVEAVATTSNLPPRGAFFVPFEVIGKPMESGERGPHAAYHEVSPDFFHTMRIPLLQGRSFTDRDNETAPGVTIISESLARQYFGDENPIGRSIHADMNSLNRTLESDKVREIVGVVGDIRMEFRVPPAPIMYVPYRQNLKDYQNNGFLGIHAIHGFALRTSGNPMKLAADVRRIFAEADSSVALTDMAPMRERLSQLAATQEFWMRLLGIFAGLGMFLAAIGVYGVISYTVEQRSHEFGIRATLGARDADILRLVLREGFWVTLIGLACGLAGAYGATRLLIRQLYGVTPMDPLTILAVAAVLSLVALLACYIPGRRATKRDPLAALRAG
jgi:putative ABC transport system permease protein